MTIAEVHQLPLSEKLQIMEAIWEDLCTHAKGVPTPAWHKELLDAREKAVTDGKEEILDWDAVKNSLGQKRQ
jgi:putative addiction module component (TIGR02574 family)